MDGLRLGLNIIKSAITGDQELNARMSRILQPGWSSPAARNTANWIDTYNKSPRLDAVHKISSDVGSSKYGLYNVNDKKKEKIIQHPALSVLKKPNPYMNGHMLFYLTEVYLLLPSGEAFWIIERNGLGMPTELWPVPPHWVYETPSKLSPYYSVYPQGNINSTLKVLSQDMIYIKEPDPLNPYDRGLGRAGAISDEVETDEYMAKYAKRFFFNDAIPPMVGMMPGADEPGINRQKEKWQQEYGGFNNKHKMAWLNWDAKFQLLKETNKDMDFIESRKFLRDVANQHFNIPPELFGILENSNRSTIDAAYYLYTKNVLSNVLRALDEALNDQFIPQFDKKLYIEHDNVVPEDKEFDLKKSETGLKNGGILVDEWRKENGWEPLPNGKGKILYTPLNMIPTTMDGETLQTNIPPPAEATPPAKEVKKKLTPEMKNRMWHVLDKAAIKNERPFINALKRYFQDQQDKINKSLEKSVKQATDEPDELLNWDEEETILLGVLTPLWLASLKEGFATVNVTFSFGLTEDFMQPKFLKWIKQFGAEQVKDINDTTKEKLRKTLSEGIAGGEGIPKLRDRVSQVMTEAKTSRAEKIARTETHNTVSNGTHETYKVANIKQREWLTSIDGRERDSHAAINGEVKGINEPFSNGLMYPGDPSGPAEEVVNCRCTELPVLPE